MMKRRLLTALKGFAIVVVAAGLYISYLKTNQASGESSLRSMAASAQSSIISELREAPGLWRHFPKVAGELTMDHKQTELLLADLLRSHHIDGRSSLDDGIGQQFMADFRLAYRYEKDDELVIGFYLRSQPSYEVVARATQQALSKSERSQAE